MTFPCIPPCNYSTSMQEHAVQSVSNIDKNNSNLSTLRMENLQLENTSLIVPQVFEDNTWKEYIFNIASLPEEPKIKSLGICGPCMLHALEMTISLYQFSHCELQLTTSGSLLPDLTGSQSALEQFSQLYPSLYAKICGDTEKLYAEAKANHAQIDLEGYIPTNHKIYYSRMVQMIFHPILGSFGLKAELITYFRPPINRQLDNYFISATLTRKDIEMKINDSILTQPTGSIWLVSMQYGEIYNSVRHFMSGHTLLLIRHIDGLGVIETNIGMSFTEFNKLLEKRFLDASELFSYLTQPTNSDVSVKRLYTLDFFQIKHARDLVLNPIKHLVILKECVSKR